MLSNIILSYLILSYLVYVGRTENSTQYINISPLRTDLAVRFMESVCACPQVAKSGNMVQLEPIRRFFLPTTTNQPSPQSSTTTAALYMAT